VALFLKYPEQRNWVLKLLKYSRFTGWRAQIRFCSFRTHAVTASCQQEVVEPTEENLSAWFKAGVALCGYGITINYQGSD